MNILDDLGVILNEDEIDIVMRSLGGEIIRMPQFGEMCKKLNISENERIKIIRGMVEKYVRKDKENKIRAQKRKALNARLPVFRGSDLFSKESLGTSKTK